MAWHGHVQGIARVMQLARQRAFASVVLLQDVRVAGEADGRQDGRRAAAPYSGSAGIDGSSGGEEPYNARIVLDPNHATFRRRAL